MRDAFHGKAMLALAALVFSAGGAMAQAGAAAAGAPSYGPGASQGAAATGAQPGQGGSNSLAPADRNFLMRAAASSLVELEAARLAADKAKDEEVKRYASMLVDHHTAANQELMALAQSKGLNLPTSLSGGKQRELTRLNRASGDDFDAAFVQGMGVREHRQELRLFREASRNAKDPDIKAWAAKMLPELEQHLTQARALPAARRPLSQPGSDGGG